MRQLPPLSHLLVYLLAATPVPATLIDFTSRTDFATNTTLNANLPTSNGVDFTTASLCPTVGCAASGSNQQFSSSTDPATANFSSIPGFTVQSFSGNAGSVVRLWLTASNWVTPPGPTVKYGTPVMNTRDLGQSVSASFKVRINLPANTNSFAIDLSNGCKINTTASAPAGCDPGDNVLGTVQVATSAGDTRVVNITDPSQTVGEFTTYAGYSDTNISYIELSLPTLNQVGGNNFGSIVFTRIAFGQVQTPEPATFLTFSAGLLALFLARYRRTPRL